MPFYEYECTSCKYYTEVMQKITDPPLRKCPSCGRNTLRKLVSAPIFRLKGAGWYETDFKTDKETRHNLAETEKRETKEPAAAETDKKAENKPAVSETKTAAEPQPSASRKSTRPRARPRTARGAVKSKNARAGASGRVRPVRKGR